jgi:hypothetical protein
MTYAWEGDVFVCIAAKDPKTRAYKIFTSSSDVAPIMHFRVAKHCSTRLNFTWDLKLNAVLDHLPKFCETVV